MQNNLNRSRGLQEEMKNIESVNYVGKFKCMLTI